MELVDLQKFTIIIREQMMNFHYKLPPCIFHE